MPNDCDKCHKTPTNNEKWKYTFITVIIFLIIANPFAYKFTKIVLGKIIGRLADNNWLLFILHTTIFTLLLRYVMELRI